MINKVKKVSLGVLFILTSCGENVPYSGLNSDDISNIQRKDLIDINNQKVIKETISIQDTIKKIVEYDIKGINFDDVKYETGNPLLASIDDKGNLTPYGTGIVEVKVIRKKDNFLLKSFSVRVQTNESGAFILNPSIIADDLDDISIIGINSAKYKPSKNSEELENSKDISIFDKKGNKSTNLRVGNNKGLFQGINDKDDILYNLNMSFNAPVKKASGGFNIFSSGMNTKGLCYFALSCVYSKGQGNFYMSPGGGKEREGEFQDDTSTVRSWASGLTSISEAKLIIDQPASICDKWDTLIKANKCDEEARKAIDTVRSGKIPSLY